MPENLAGTWQQWFPSCSPGVVTKRFYENFANSEILRNQSKFPKLRENEPYVVKCRQESRHLAKFPRLGALGVAQLCAETRLCMSRAPVLRIPSQHACAHASYCWIFTSNHRHVLHAGRTHVGGGTVNSMPGISCNYWSWIRLDLSWGEGEKGGGQELLITVLYCTVSHDSEPMCSPAFLFVLLPPRSKISGYIYIVFKAHVSIRSAKLCR